MPAVSRLTPKLRDELCEKLKRGHYKLAACSLVGIHRDTLLKWETRGRQARALREEGLAVPRRELPYLQLLEAIEFATDFGEGWLMEQALNAIENPKDARWQGYVTILERSRPDRWRRRASTEYAKPPEGRPGRGVDFEKLSPQQRAALKEILLEAIHDD